VTLRLGWFATARGETSPKILRYVTDAIAAGKLDACIEYVFCNREPGESPKTDEFLRLVRRLDIPLVAFSSKKYLPECTDPEHRREAYDREVYRLVKDFCADIVVLAGYMRIVSGYLCRRLTMINLHPALPGGPQGTWQEVIAEVVRSQVRRHGLMMHLVTEQLDRGPVLTYASFSTQGLDADGVRAAGVARELPLVLRTLQLLASGRIAVRHGVVYAQGHPVPSGVRLAIRPLPAV
jgi:phosphoribosylglycinamide formyltransferase-1